MAKIWDQIIGNDVLKQNFQKLCQNSHLHHANILSGPSGLGKKLFSLAVAQKLLCRTQDACGHCSECLRVAKQEHESLRFVKAEGQNIKIEQIRELHQFLQLKSIGNARIIIIEDAEKMNPQASNTLLKILEEPPENTYFFLISSNLFALLPTIRSRAQIFRFKPLQENELKQLSDAAQWQLKASQGRLDILQQWKDSDKIKNRALAFDFLASPLQQSNYQAFAFIKELSQDRESLWFCIHIWQQFFRDLLVQKSVPSELIHIDKVDLLKAYSKLSQQQILQLWEKNLSLEKDITQNIDKSLALENFWILIRQCVKLA